MGKRRRSGGGEGGCIEFSNTAIVIMLYITIGHETKNRSLKKNKNLHAISRTIF